MKNLGQYIRELRDKKDLSLRELAKKVSCSAAFLSDIELGRRYPSDELLSKISKELGIKKSELEKYDIREDIQDFKKISQIDAKYAFAFRQVVNKKIDPDKLIKILKKLESK